MIKKGGIMNNSAHRFETMFGMRLLMICALIISYVICFSPGSAKGSNLSLISPASLYAREGSFIIIDARPFHVYKKGHIPGAISLSWEDYTTTDRKNIPYRILPPETLAKKLGMSGISEISAVAVYGDTDSSWGGEGWVVWMLSFMGHKGDIRLLEGGVDGWIRSKYPIVEMIPEKFPPAVYQFDIQAGLNISTDELRAKATDFQIIDTRSFFERIKGKIPGSVHISWEKFFNPENHRPVNTEELKKMFSENNISVEKPVVYYCTGGIRSAYAWTVHQLSGLKPARNYEGGMADWSASNP